MAVVNGAKYHSEKASGFFFFDSLVRHDVVEQLATTGVLHHNVDMISRFYYIVKTNDMRMVKKF